MNLTKPQKLIYDMEKFVGGSVSVVCAGMLIEGTKTETEIQSAANELFRINDALRIRIEENGGKVTQHIEPFSKQPIEILQFSDKSELDSYAQKYAQKPIKLTDCLCEIKVIILPQQYGLLVKMHHIISDAWTFALLGTQFNSLMNKKEPVSYSYFDYCEAEKKYLSSKRFLKDKEFFLEQLKEYDEPAFISEKNTKSFKSERKTFVTDSHIAKKINDFALENNCSVFSLFATAFAAYMKRTVLNTDNFFIGTTVLNRHTEQDINTAGMFINTVPVLLTTKDGNTFIQSLEKTEDSLLSVFRHQKYNYKDLLTDIRRKNNSDEKLYDVILNYMNASLGGIDDATQSTWYSCGMQNESLQIHIDDRDNEGVYIIQYDYQTEKFTEREIEMLHIHLMNLLLDGIENRNKKLIDLNLSAESEVKKILYDFNDTAREYSIPSSSTIYSLFEETAEKNKTKTCITTAEKAITFGELLHLSEVLDEKIRSVTGNKKSIVAVIADRSIEMYSAIYGIIRGGNAYLPISPEYPRERIDYILQNSGAVLVLCQGKYAHLAGDTPHIDMTEFIKSPMSSAVSLPCAANPDDTAYVIYTSGSTGNPKGAKVSHKSAVNRILWMHDKYPLEKDSVILQKTPYTFDVSVWELFWWGMCGGSLAASKPGEHFLPAKILDEVNNNKVTHLHFVPSVFDLFLNYLESHKEELDKFSSVKHVFLSGEALTATLVQRFYTLYDYNSVKLHNLYGPTECAVDVTYYDCAPIDVDPVPIGKPIYNTQIYVVDKYMNILPIGVKGELCIGGVNVGQGYLNNEKLTNEKFVDNPFGEGKLYKTGDLAYWREDGQIIFCGRMDGQVKLGGQRIEIGEIEAVIGNIPKVESVAVIMRKLNGRDALVAFYCGEKNRDKIIRSICETKLPKYMVPAAICHIEELPLNQSGKLDRKALFALEVDLNEFDDFEEPTNEYEKTICDAFREVLEEEKIGRNSDFFDLGGSSLSMITVLSEDMFKDIAPSDFIANPTPKKLAKLIKDKKMSELKYLEILREAENAEKSIVLFPFAGGGAEAYTSFVNSVKAQSSNASLYFVRYLHTKEECEEAAKEIADALNGTDLYFYSHCVGSAVAMQILKHLEKDKRCNVKHYIAGASMPPKKPQKKNAWDIVPDKVLKAVLVKAGAPLNAISDEKAFEILKNFRADTDFAVQAFAEDHNKIKAPVSVVISKKDMFTYNYKQAEKIWKKYAETVNGIHFIDSSTHYFQSDNSDELVRIVLSIVD